MKIPRIILYVIIVALGFFVFQQYTLKRNAIKAQNNVREYLSDTISYYTNKQGKKVAHIKALEGEKSELLILLNETSSQLKSLTEKYKSVKAALELKQEVRIDSVFIPYKKPLQYDFNVHWAKKDKWYSITGTSTRKGIGINSLTLYNTLSVVIGDRETGFWKYEYRVEAVNSNPLIQTNDIDAYYLNVPRKRFGIGAFAGWGISKTGLSPMIGFGVTFDFIQF